MTIKKEKNEMANKRGPDSEYFHLIFEFQDVKKIGDWKNELFHSAIGNECRELKENVLEDGNRVIYHVKILDPENFHLKFPHEASEFKSKYKKILKKLTIEYHGSEDLNEDDLNWKTLDSFYSDARNYHSADDLFSVFYLFTASMDALTLEMHISNILLYQFDPAEREKYIDSLKLEKPYSIFRKLFGTASYLTDKEIRQVFSFIDTNDFIIKKAIFTYLLQKDRSKKMEGYYKIFKDVVGVDPFNERELRDMEDSTSIFDIFFEFFFKQYYAFSGLKDKVEQFDDLDKVYKIQIPINPKAYNLKIYTHETTEFIQNKFHDDLKLILNSCERVIYHETKRLLNKRLDNLIVCFDYSISEEYLEELKKNDIYFDSQQSLIVSRDVLFQDLLKSYNSDANPEFRFYCIFEGNYTEMKVAASITGENQFGIKDINEDTILVKYWKHKSYFIEKELSLEVPVVVQAFLHLKCRMIGQKWIIIQNEVYLEIIDVDVVRAFKPISITLGKNRSGVVKLENTPEGLRRYRYASKGEPSYEKILHKPIHLLAFYEGENEFFYEIQIGKEKVCKTKSDLCNWIELETNFASTSGKDLKDSISNVLFAYIKENKLTALPMFHSAGIFLKDDEFVIVHPFKEDLTVIGENDIQHEYIKRIKDKGLDVNGDLIKNFYDVLEIKGIREDIRAGIFGYASMQPFFFALSKVLDIFPNVFVIGIHGSGKTTLAEIVFNMLYGTKMKAADSIDSPARITKYSTESTFVLNIDDIDILEEKSMNFIKTSSTRKGTRDRLTMHQKLLSEQTYASYAGTANNRNFLAGNENDAFRKRCLIYETMEGIKITDDATLFEEVKFNIGDGKIVGFYLLEKAIEFFKSLSNRNITAYFKLIAHINEIRKKLKQKIIEKEIPLSDGRRLTIYTLIYIGWEIWNYTFTQKGLKSKILEKYLDLNETIVWNFIDGLEATEKDITITTFDSVLEFFEQKRDLFMNKKTSKGDIFIQTNFIEQYDKFAKQRGYDILRNLKEFANLQSQILGYDINPGKKHVRSSTDGSSKTEYGCVFYYQVIKDKRIKRVKDGLSVEDKQKMSNLLSKVWEFFEDNGFEMLDIDNLMDALEVYFEDKTYVENALDYLFDNDFLTISEIDEDKCKIKKKKFDSVKGGLKT